jgi:MFS transporter, DHA1 family, tetracycline resistance protein
MTRTDAPDAVPGPLTSAAPSPAEPGKRALTFIVGVVLLDAIGFGIIMPVMPGLIVELTGTSLADAAVLGGWLFFSFALTQFFAAPILGNLSDRYGRRPVLLLSLLMFSVDYLIMGLSPSLAFLFVGRVLAGIPGAAYTPAYAYLADISPPSKRAQHFGMAGAAFGVGFILGPAIGGVLGEFGTRAPFFAASALAFLNLVLGYFALPESLPIERRRPFAWRRANPAGALAHLRSYPQVLGLAAVSFCFFLAMQAYPTVWAFYTISTFGWTEVMVGSSLAFVGGMMIVSQGVLTRVLIPRLGEGRVGLLALAAASICFLGQALATQTWMLFAWMTLWLLAGMAMPTMNALLSQRVPPTAQGELQGANASLMGLAAIAGPLLFPMLFGTFSRPGAAVALPGAPYVVAAALAMTSALLLARALRQHAAAAKDATAIPVPTPTEAAPPQAPH